MKQPRSFRVDAVVLRHHDWGEADRILTLYSQQRGKLRAIAKGARKVRSRKAGHLEPFTHVALQLAAGRDLMIVTQAETINAYIPLRDNLELTVYAANVMELVDRFMYGDGDANPSLFRLLTHTLTRLARGDHPWLVVRYFEMRMLDFLGFRPQLFECANCSVEIKAQDQFFSTLQGGVLCPKCGLGLPGVHHVSMDSLRYLRHFQRSTYQQARKAQPSDRQETEIELIMQHYLTYLLERELNSPGFLKRIRNKS